MYVLQKIILYPELDVITNSYIWQLSFLVCCITLYAQQFTAVVIIQCNGFNVRHAGDNICMDSELQASGGHWE